VRRHGSHGCGLILQRLGDLVPHPSARIHISVNVASSQDETWCSLVRSGFLMCVSLKYGCVRREMQHVRVYSDHVSYFYFYYVLCKVCVYSRIFMTCLEVMRSTKLKTVG
jgi:hypothetical protein